MTLPSPIKYHIYTGQDILNSWPYAYVLAQNGLFKLVDTPHFYASLRLSAARVAGLRCWPEEGVLLRVPKIPATWLAAVLADARCVSSVQVSGVRCPVEQMYHFHHFRAADKWPFGWQVSRPRQQATAGSVRYHGGEEPTIVLDLHSHHEMPAYFSGTDNRDEQGCRFYAVIGRIYSRPEIRLRLGVYGDFFEFPAAALFEGLGEFNDPHH